MDRRVNSEFQELYDCLIGFTKLALSKYVSPFSLDANVLRIHETGYSIIRQKVNRYSLVNVEEMVQSSEYRKCVELLGQIPKINTCSNAGKQQPKPDEWDLESHIRVNYLEPLIIGVAEKTHCQFKLVVFNEMYAELENLLKDTELQWRTLKISPLPHFQSEVEEIDLTDGLKIRKISWEERESIFLDLSESSPIMCGDIGYLLGSCDFFVECVWGGNGRPVANVQKVALALSLFQPNSRVDYYGSINYRMLWTKSFAGVSGGAPLGHSDPYTLTKREAGKFLSFWKDEFLPIIGWDEHLLQVALSRFEDYRRRANSSMGLVDLVICLEAMYLRADQELAYRLSHRCATILGYGKSAEEKERIRNFIKAAYFMRSKLVHGDKVDWERIRRKHHIQYESLSDFIQQTSEFVRQSIRLFLALAAKHELGQRKHQKFLQVVDGSIYCEKPLREYLSTNTVSIIED
ncbi:MAG: HEPN domain-containing protein [Candidatus Bathyarchaeota archaeon]|nr:HEPN domain-containing protein [Candidatus Bathyarchaeota archaeon]